jgi:hypothetical protein
LTVFSNVLWLQLIAVSGPCKIRYEEDRMSLRRGCLITMAVLSVIGFPGCQPRYGYFPPPPGKDVITSITLGKDSSGNCTQNGVEGGKAVVQAPYQVNWIVPNATSLTVTLSAGCSTPVCTFSSASSGSVSGTLTASTSPINYSSITTSSGQLCTVSGDGLIMK